MKLTQKQLDLVARADALAIRLGVTRDQALGEIYWEAGRRFGGPTMDEMSTMANVKRVREKLAAGAVA